jgi:TPR repeat protein
MRSLILRGLVLALLVSGYTAGATIAFAGPFEDAIAAYDRHEYGTALQLMRPLAEQGDADAQNGLGALYYHGYGVTQDFKEAIKWYRLAAAQGNLNAQVNLGSMYYEGEGVAEDLAHSHMWLSIAAERGYPEAAKMRDTVLKEMTAAQASQAQAIKHKCQASNYKECD